MDKLKRITLPVVATMMFGAVAGVAVHLYKSRREANAEAQSQSSI